MAELLRGAPIVKKMVGEIADRVRLLRARNVVPTLLIVRVGDNPSDLSYERSLKKRAQSVGVVVETCALAEDASTNEVLDIITRANSNVSIHGVLIFRPLPHGIDEEAIAAALDPAKDVDGISPISVYGVLSAKSVGFAPCTAEAVVEMLTRANIELEGARVTIVGRSMVVGRPLAALLMARNATITVCHTRTRDIAACCREADIIISATGHPGTIDAEAVRSGQIVIDVGTTWDDAAGKLVGDVVFDDVEPIVDAITPVPGGVGALTTVVLMRHVAAAAECLVS